MDPCDDPLYLIILRFRVEILSVTGLSSFITQSATYSSNPYLVSDFSPVSPVMIAVSPLVFNHPNNLRSSALKMNSLGNPANNASKVSNTIRFAPIFSIAYAKRMNKPSESNSPVSSISLLSRYIYSTKNFPCFSSDFKSNPRDSKVLL